MHAALTISFIKVTLHLYDLSPLNEALQPIGLGVYHTGLSIGGSEWTFAGGAGIFSHDPREPGGGEARFREAVDMGMAPAPPLNCEAAADCER
jgi:hypothetical protein